jgi:hypothetical protein
MLDFFRVINTRLGSNVRTVLANLVGFGTTGDDDNAERADDCEVIQPIGLIARPVLDADTEALVYRDGDEHVVIGFVRKSSTVHDCETGETQLYSDKEPLCRIRLRANGKIEITAKAGQDIVLNGGNASVGRVGDAVNPSAAMTTWMGQVATATMTTAPVGAIGAIAAGASNVKA